jgi:hypothetical protein
MADGDTAAPRLRVHTGGVHTGGLRRPRGFHRSRAEDGDCVRGAAPCLAPSDSHGFTVDEAAVVFWGACPDCAGPGHAGPDVQPHHHEEMTK